MGKKSRLAPFEMTVGLVQTDAGGAAGRLIANQAAWEL